MGQTASQFPYDLGEEVRPPARGPPTTWKVYRARSKAQGQAVTVFSFEKKLYGAAELDAARNALQRLKTLRHPHILRFVDGVELEETLFVVTEEVEPLDLDAPEYRGDDAEAFLALGLRQLVVAVSFLNNDCKMVHANVCPASVFVTPAGEWKLGGFDVVYPHGGPVAAVTRSNVATIVPKHYRAPFRSWQDVEAGPAWATDAWSLACVFYEAFHHDFRSENQLGQPARLPRSLRGVYAKLLQSEPRDRLNPQRALECPFFKNDLVESVDFLANLPIKGDDEKREFFAGFAGRVDGYIAKPSLGRVLRNGVLPRLAKALEFGSATAAFPAALESALKIGATVTQEEFEEALLPCLVKLYGRNERAVRMQLLTHLDKYAKHLRPAVAADKIWPQVRTGFADQYAGLRELSLKSIVHFVPLLPRETVENEVMRIMARLQTDQEASIRTNTTYCLGKVAPSLSADTRRRVLASAFARCLRDPFVPARVAGLSAFFACSAYFDAAQTVQRVLPAVLPCTLDQNKEVREAALRALGVFAQVLRDHSDNMDAVDQPLGAPGAAKPSDAAGAAGAAKKAAGLLGSVGSWAVNSISTKLAGGGGGGGGGAAAAGSQQASRQQAAAAAPQQQQRQAAPQRGQQLAKAAPKAAPAKAAGSGSSWDDDFFGDDGDGAAAVVPAKLGGGAGRKPRKTAAERKAEREAKRAARKTASPMSLGAKKPAAGGSAGEWDGWDELGGGGGGAAAAPVAAPSSGDDFFASLDAGGGAGANDDPFGPLDPAPPAQPAEDDPFAALGMATGPPRKAGAGLSLGGAKPKRAAAARPAAAAPRKAAPKKAAGGGGDDDDWESFLNG